MGDWPSLSRAPIVEVALDIRTKLPAAANLSRLSDIGRHLGSDFPTKQIRRNVKINVEDKEEDVQIQTQKEDIGYIFFSLSKDAAVQARLDGYTYSKLKPYQGWPTFFEQAQKSWHTFEKVARPEIVTRLGLRYINRLEIPGATVRLEDYFTTYPKIGDGVPQTLAGHIMRVELVDSETELTALLTMTVGASPPEKNIIPFIVDIDVVKSVTFAPQEGRFWEKFEAMRDLKNKIFFNSLTQKSLDLIL